MGILDIIYNIVNKSKGKKKGKKSSKKKKKREKKSNSKKNNGSQQQKQKIEQKLVINDLSNTNELLKSWDSSVKNITDHPLSQVKIINTQILEQLTAILGSMNQKMDKLGLLDEVLELLRESRTEIVVSGGSTAKIDKAIGKIENLTIKDEEVIRVLNDKGPQTANKLSRIIGVSRSTASSRLNRLHDMGVVRKKAEGKKVFYSLYSKNND